MRRAGRTASAFGTLAALLVSAGCSSGGKPSSAPPRTGSSSSVSSSGSPSTSTSVVSCPTACLARPEVVARLLATARTALPQVVGYDYRHLARDHDRAVAAITPAYRTEFEAAWAVVAQQAPARQAMQSVKIAEVGVAALDSRGSRATVLVFAQSSFTSSTQATARIDLINASVRLQRSGATWLVAGIDNDGAIPATASDRFLGTAGLLAALTAGRREALNLTTYHRASFDQDYLRTVAGATDPFRATLLLGDARSRLRTQMQAAHFDTRGTVNAAAVAAVDPQGTVTLLVQVDTEKLPDGGTPSITQRSRFVLTVKRVGAHWLVSDLQAVGVR